MSQENPTTQAISSTQIERLAHTPRLLVVSDFDGTVCSFSIDPTNVPIDAPAMAALHRLAELPETEVVLLSGRDLVGLIAVSKLDPEGAIALCGSHGAQEYTGPQSVDLSSGGHLSPAQHQALDEVTKRLDALIAGTPAYVEHKPFHRVLHLLPVEKEDPTLAAKLSTQALALNVPGATAKPGHHIVEFAVTDATKGTWIAARKQTYTPSATVFLGDDRTDEDGFAVLSGDDLSIKVGSGQTKAMARVANPREVGEFLTALADARQVFLQQR